MDYAGEVTLLLQTTAASPLSSPLSRYRGVDMTPTIDSPGCASTSLAAAVFTQRRGSDGTSAVR